MRSGITLRFTGARVINLRLEKIKLLSNMLPRRPLQALVRSRAGQNAVLFPAAFYNFNVQAHLIVACNISVNL